MSIRYQVKVVLKGKRRKVEELGVGGIFPPHFYS